MSFAAMSVAVNVYSHSDDLLLAQIDTALGTTDDPLLVP